jgi:sarcosine oxidase / L-pipecolate oxidase
MSTKNEYTYLIVGSGVFGASTAYHLSKTHTSASITLLDRSSTFPCSLAASYDYNKMVRADYENKFYCKLALEAREAWKSEELYKSFFHESGMVVLNDTGLGSRIIKNYEELNAYSEATVFGKEELKERYGGLFGDVDLRGVEEVFVNPLSGWAEATNAIKAVIDAAVSNGVKYLEGDVQRLLFNDSGDCIGVRIKDGR